MAGSVGRVRGKTVVMAAALLAGCGGPAELDAGEAWVRLPAVPGRPAAAYFNVEGGREPRTLIRVTADYALRSELHETVSGGGHMAMRAIRSVSVPAGGEVAFEPGGRHVMLYDLDPRAKPGTTTLLTLTFENGQRLQRKAWIFAADADAPR